MDDIIDTFRLGKPTGGRRIDKPSISRRILVKTRACHVKEAVMNRRFARLRGVVFTLTTTLHQKSKVNADPWSPSIGTFERKAFNAISTVVAL